MMQEDMEGMCMKILVLNAGSNSQKSCLYEIGNSLPCEPPEPLWQASADWTAQQGKVVLAIKSHAQERPERQVLPLVKRAEVLKHMLTSLWDGPARVVRHPDEVQIVGHRVVHGGPAYRHSVRVTPEVQAAIEHYAFFAPVHNPANLEGMRTVEEMLPQAKQAAVFDTAFHHHLPLAAAVYPGLYEWYERGIRRHGFHGINHQYCAQRASDLLGRDLASL